VVVNVSRNKIHDVLNLEATAVAVNPQTLNQKKTIVIISNNTVVAVAIISRISNYDPDKYKNVWEGINASWKSVIEFHDVILLEVSVNSVFGPTNTIKNTQTVGYLKTPDVNSLINAITTLYLIHITSYLKNIGIE